MKKILVVAENTHGHLKRSAAELLTAARKSGYSVITVCFGSNSGNLVQELGKYGTQEVHLFKDSIFDNYNPELFTSAFCELIKKTEASVILASASSFGKDLFPRIAARLNAGIISDCTDLKIDGDSVTVKRPIYAAKAFAKMGFDSSSSLKIVLMRANQLPVEEISPNSPTVHEHAFNKKDFRTIIKEVVKGTSEKLDLTEANIIVSGGRGLKDAANFKLLENLANVLGATVGASRAVVDLGWVPHEMQVGQTGKTVAPTLYIAIGISGAIQHLAGMSGSKVIVAINSDPNAPIFQKSTYGIVGDFSEVLPKLTEEFKKVLH